jgi:hypothetical protein
MQPTRNPARRRPRPWLMRTAAGTALLGALLAAPVAAQEATALPAAVDKVEDTRAMLDKWVETRSVIAKERRDWQLGKEMLQQRIEVIKQEIATLRGKIGDAEKSLGDAEKKHQELIRDNARLKEASSALQGVVGALEARTKTLLKQLPEPIKERTKPLSQQLPDNIADNKLSLGQRFMNVIGILNEVDKFQREITVASEVRQIGDGSTAEVTAIYIGLGQAYYVNNKGTAAGIGTPTADGWVWKPANDAAPRIARAIAILKNEKVAEFVPLPVQIL